MHIPKLIHQIWIGPKKRPDIWMDSVRKFCEEFGYEYVLWDDKKVSEMNMVNRSFYNKEPTYNGKSDILRYEILYQYGGVYIDADSVIIRGEKFDKLLQEFKSDAGFGFEVDYKLICGGVSISIKESKFMEQCIKAIPKRDFNQPAWISIGPKLITDMYPVCTALKIPIYLYPSKTFYPIRWHGIQSVNMHETMNIPEESVMFQYGYSTNNLETKI